MAIKLRVKNTGDRVVERLGFEFRPGKEQEVEVHSARDKLTIDAVAALEVEEVKEEKSSDEEKASASSQDKRSNKRG